MPKNILDNHLLEDELDRKLKQVLTWWQQALLFSFIYLIPFLVLRYFTRTIIIVRWSPIVDLLTQGLVASFFYVMAIVVIEKLQRLKIPKPIIKLRIEPQIITFYIVMAGVFTLARMIVLIFLIGATMLLGIQNIEQFFVDFFIIDIIIVIIDCLGSLYYTTKRIKQFETNFLLAS